MKRIFIFLLFSLVLTAFGFSQADLQPVATINLIRTEQITVRQLRTEVERMERMSGRTLSQAERGQVLDVMINERLAIQGAERDRALAAAAGFQLTATESDINEQMQQLRGAMQQQLGRPPTESEFAQAVREESGLDVPAFREQLRRQMIIQKYLMYKKGDLINGSPFLSQV